jgi:hypothetical protein
MNHRTATAALLLAATSIPTGALIAAQTGAAGATTPTSLDLVLRLPEARATQVDAPPLHSAAKPDDSPGDAVVLHAPVHRPGGAKAGLIDAVFTTTATADREQILATFSVGPDQIAVQGIDAAASTDHVAIVGGTGRYAGAHGTLTSTEAGPQRRFHFTFRR